MDEQVRTIVVVHYAPAPKGDPESIAAEMLKAQYSSISRRDENDSTTNSLSVYFEAVNLKQAGIVPPSADQLRYFGRGVTSEQAQAMERSSVALFMVFSYGRSQVFTAVEQLTRFAADVATRTDGLLWDDETRELFSAAAWNESRSTTWSDGVPLVLSHTTVHAYKNTDYVRAVSLGMRKFGMPDVVINDFSWSISAQMGNALNAVQQLLVEGAPIPSTGPFDLDIRAIKHKVMREALTESLVENAQGQGKLTLKASKREDGDPDNRLLELTFDRYQGKTAQAKQERFAYETFGARDSVTMTKHTDEVLAASERAQQKFETFRKQFEKGLEPGEHLMVKAPFETDDGGTEWMWVEVIKWQGRRITGLLKNDPQFVEKLHAGDTVRVNQDDVFDYIRYTADGKMEGNETGPLLQRAVD